MCVCARATEGVFFLNGVFYLWYATEKPKSIAIAIAIAQSTYTKIILTLKYCDRNGDKTRHSNRRDNLVRWFIFPEMSRIDFDPTYWTRRNDIISFFEASFPFFSPFSILFYTAWESENMPLTSIIFFTKIIKHSIQDKKVSLSF